MCGANMTGFVQCEIDTELAASIWELLDAVDHMTTPPKAIALRLEKRDDGKIEMFFDPYKEGTEKDDEVEAVIHLEPTEDEGVDEIVDSDLRKAMRFMYFYQAVYSQVQPYELGLK